MALAALGAWAYLGYQSWAMAHMDMVDMTMPDMGEWGAGDLALVFSMWAIMMVGMMAPAASPVVLLYARLQQERRVRGWPVVRSWIFLLGYLTVWTGFSAAATALQWGLHAAALLAPMMDQALPVAGGAILVAAGLYQWTPVKNACLAKCRSPLGFILTEWRDGARGALVMGMRHGVLCTGCCWALMLVLFAVGVMNLYWVAALALFVLLEKTLPGGQWLARAAGVLLVAWGGWMTAL